MDEAEEDVFEVCVDMEVTRVEIEKEYMQSESFGFLQCSQVLT